MEVLHQPLQGRVSKWLLAALALSLSGCQGDGGGTITPPTFCSSAPAPTTLTIAGYTPNDGVFDPSLTEDACNRIWMSYSAVNNYVVPTDTTQVLRLVTTRLARVSSTGLVWEDRTEPGLSVSAVETIPGSPTIYRAWINEVSRLVYDPHTIDASQRWKLMWHRYRVQRDSAMSPTDPDLQQFEHGWIALKTAPSADGPWSPERKFFVGSYYDAATNGAAENDLSAIVGLGNCAVFTEPGVLATSSGLYISMNCFTGNTTTGRIVFMRCNNQSSLGSCVYLGSILANSVAGNLDSTFVGFSASDIVRSNGRDFLLASPFVTSTNTNFYRGCVAYEITNLDGTTLLSDSNGPVVQATVPASSGSFHYGACAHTQANTSLGILYSEVAASAPHFTIQSSGTQLPP